MSLSNTASCSLSLSLLFHYLLFYTHTRTRYLPLHKITHVSLHGIRACGSLINSTVLYFLADHQTQPGLTRICRNWGWHNSPHPAYPNPIRELWQTNLPQERYACPNPHTKYDLSRRDSGARNASVVQQWRVLCWSRRLACCSRLTRRSNVHARIERGEVGHVCKRHQNRNQPEIVVQENRPYQSPEAPTCNQKESSLDSRTLRKERAFAYVKHANLANNADIRSDREECKESWM